MRGSLSPCPGGHSQATLDVCDRDLYLLSSRDEDMDGEWEAPQVPNPACETAPGCGAWKRPTIDNPNYKGKWKPPMIDNPNYQVHVSVTDVWFLSSGQLTAEDQLQSV